MNVVGSDGVYTRPLMYEPRGEDPEFHPDLRAVLDQFAGSPVLLIMSLRVASEMEEYGLDPTSDDGQQTVARVLRKRLTRTDHAVDSTPEALQRHRAIDQAAGESFVYYVDLYGVAIKIGFSTNVLTRLVGLRRKTHHLLALEPGGRSVESLRHRQFALERDPGRTEDFERSDRLLEHIEQLCGTHGSPMDLLAKTGARKSA